jgi:hypothetical protein
MSVPRVEALKMQEENSYYFSNSFMALSTGRVYGQTADLSKSYPLSQPLS